MKPPQEKLLPKRERLTESQSGLLLWTSIVLALGFDLSAVQAWYSRHWLIAALLIALAVFQTLNLFAHWRLHNRVVSGAKIYTKVQSTTQVPVALSIFVTGSMTVLAAVASIGSFFLFRSAIMTLIGMMVFCSVNFFLWLLVAFLW